MTHGTVGNLGSSQQVEYLRTPIQAAAVRKLRRELLASLILLFSFI
jgi:hypothetical protein